MTLRHRLNTMLSPCLIGENQYRPCYRDATLRAIKAGFDGVEISIAQRCWFKHFFSFFSADHYGCRLIKNRARLCLKLCVRYKNWWSTWQFYFKFEQRQKKPEVVLGYTDEFNQLIDWVMDVSNINIVIIAGADIFIQIRRVHQVNISVSQLTNCLWTFSGVASL